MTESMPGIQQLDNMFMILHLVYFSLHSVSIEVQGYACAIAINVFCLLCYISMDTPQSANLF